MKLNARNLGRYSVRYFWPCLLVLLVACAAKTQPTGPAGPQVSLQVSPQSGPVGTRFDFRVFPAALSDSLGNKLGTHAPIVVFDERGAARYQGQFSRGVTKVDTQWTLDTSGDGPCACTAYLMVDGRRDAAVHFVVSAPVATVVATTAAGARFKTGAIASLNRLIPLLVPPADCLNDISLLCTADVEQVQRAFAPENLYWLEDLAGDTTLSQPCGDLLLASLHTIDQVEQGYVDTARWDEWSQAQAILLSTRTRIANDETCR